MSVALEGPPVECRVGAFDRERLLRSAEQVLHGLACADAELSVTLTDDAGIAELNEQWRARSGPTDVLSFSLLEGEHADFRGGLLGDVVIGLEVAERQAAEAGIPLDEELERLLIHGVLHLLGHDHEEPEEAKRMNAEEDRLLRLLAS